MSKHQNRLEQYLQQVCRSMGGPRELREHVRQELREHLLDAASQHQAAGLSEEAALDKALLEFGQPETVRSELEATHGHRMMMALVLDKALQWKEMTMKAKWLWTTWTYLTVVAVIALEIFFCFFQLAYIIPKIKKLKADGFFNANDQSDPYITRIFDFLGKVCEAADWVSWWFVLIILAVWGLFEWRVKSENKSFIRLSILGTVALGLMVVVIMMAGSLMVLPVVAMPPLVKMVKAEAVESLDAIDKMVQSLEATIGKASWNPIQQQANDISTAMKTFNEGPKLSSLVKRNAPPYLHELEEKWKAIQEAFKPVQTSIETRHTENLTRSLKAFRALFDPFHELAKRPGQ